MISKWKKKIIILSVINANLSLFISFLCSCHCYFVV